MKRALVLLLMTTMTSLPLALAAQAQEKPAEKASSIPFAKRQFDMHREKNTKKAALNATMNQKVEAAFKGEEKLRAAMQADLKAIRAEKNPQTRKTLIAAYQAKYEKDNQRILAKANIDLQGYASQLRAIDPSKTYTVAGTKIVVKAATAQSQPAQSSQSSQPTSRATIKDLMGGDYRFTADNNCAPGAGSSTHSGGYMTSQSEGCSTTGIKFHEFEVPANTAGRIEVTADLKSEAHTISTWAVAESRVSLIRLSDDRELEAFEVNADATSYIVGGDDDYDNKEGGLILRDLTPGHYRIQALTSAYNSGVSFGWEASEARVQKLRVRIITTPK